jgi:acid phosphatase class B
MNIKSFISIIPHVKDKTLIICDIDDTFLRYEKGFGYFYDKVKSKYTKREALKQAEILYNIYKQKNLPKLTDYSGFTLLMHILKNKGEIVFLTARSEEEEEYTRKEFSYLGINYDYFKVYYTGDKISKGQFIKKHFKIRGINVIFIDDFL